MSFLKLSAILIQTDPKKLKFIRFSQNSDLKIRNNEHSSKRLGIREDWKRSKRIPNFNMMSIP